LWWPLTVLKRQTRQAVHAIKQSILLRCLWSEQPFPFNVTLSSNEFGGQGIFKLSCHRFLLKKTNKAYFCHQGAFTQLTIRHA
jgi:hypothetical protein